MLRPYRFQQGLGAFVDLSTTVTATPEIEARVDMFDSAESGEPPIKVATKHRDAMAGKVLRQRRLADFVSACFTPLAWVADSQAVTQF